VIAVRSEGTSREPAVGRDGTLGLEPAADLLLQVHGITGSAQVPSVQIHRLEAGALVIADTRFPVLWAPVMAGADTKWVEARGRSMVPPVDLM
jgi:hypothetical protein